MVDIDYDNEYGGIYGDEIVRPRPAMRVVDALEWVAACAKDVLENCVPDPDEEGPCTELRAALDMLDKARGR